MGFWHGPYIMLGVAIGCGIWPPIVCLFWFSRLEVGLWREISSAKGIAQEPMQRNKVANLSPKLLLFIYTLAAK